MTIPRVRPAALAVRLSAAVLAGVAMTGCIKMDMDLTLDGDTASGSVIVAMDRSLLEMEGLEADDALGNFGAEEELPEDAAVEPYEDDTYVGQRFSFDGAALSEFDDPESVSITYDAEDGRYEVTGAMDMTDMATDGGEMPAGMANAMLESFDMRIAITFPGEVIEHNGELSGNTVTWRPVAGEANEIRAVASDGSSSDLPVWLVAGLGGLAVVIAAGVVVFFVLRNRGKPATGPSENGPESGDATRS